jgi:hypothetical protein
MTFLLAADVLEVAAVEELAVAEAGKPVLQEVIQ